VFTLFVFGGGTLVLFTLFVCRRSSCLMYVICVCRGEFLSYLRYLCL
jgi:hypothetical protein